MEYIYCMKTILDGLVKIGKTKNFNQRMRLLESNGYRNITGLKRYFAIEVDNGLATENKLKDKFKHCQVGNSELLSADINEVVEKMSELGKEFFPNKGEEKETRDIARDNRGLYYVPEGKYYYIDKNNKRRATIYIDREHEIKLQRGSIIANTPTKSFIEKGFKSYLEWSNIQKEHIKNDRLIDDYICSSLSLAASIVLATYKDGWKFWKDSDGNYITKYRKATFVLDDNE